MIRHYYSNMWYGCSGAWCPSLGATGGILVDRSRYGSNASLVDMDWSNWTTSENGLSLQLDGLSEYIDIPARSVPQDGNLSVSMWVKVNELPGGVDGCLFFIGDGSYDRIYMSVQSYWAGNVISFNAYDGTVHGIYNTGPVCNAGVWMHLCGTIGDGVYKLYVNGLLAQSGSGSPVSIANPIVNIGGYNGSRFINCQFDDTMVFNRTLSPSEVRILSYGRRMAYSPVKPPIISKVTPVTVGTQTILGLSTILGGRTISQISNMTCT